MTCEHRYMIRLHERGIAKFTRLGELLQVTPAWCPECGGLLLELLTVEDGEPRRHAPITSLEFWGCEVEVIYEPAEPTFRWTTDVPVEAGGTLPAPTGGPRPPLPAAAGLGLPDTRGTRAACRGVRQVFSQSNRGYD